MSSTANNSKVYIVISVQSHYGYYNQEDVHANPPKVHGVYDFLEKADQVARKVTSCFVKDLIRRDNYHEYDMKEQVEYSDVNRLFKAEWRCMDERQTSEAGHYFAVQVEERVINDDRHEDTWDSEEEEDEEEDKEDDEDEDKEDDENEVQIIDGPKSQEDDDEVQFVGMGTTPSNKRQRTED